MAELELNDLVREVQETRDVADTAVSFINAAEDQIRRLQEIVSTPATPDAPAPAPEDDNSEAQAIVDELVAALDAVQAKLGGAVAPEAPAPAPAEDPSPAPVEETPVSETPVDEDQAPADVPEADVTNDGDIDEVTTNPETGAPVPDEVTSEEAVFGN